MSPHTSLGSSDGPKRLLYDNEWIQLAGMDVAS